MSKTVTPYNTSASKKEQVSEMFDNIAHSYDFLNHFLSLGIDNIWRKKAIASIAPINPKQILDVATGTGDLALAALKVNPDKVTGIDISKEMVAFGVNKIAKKNLSDKVELMVGDSEALPFEDNSFDAITVAFGVRNFENLEKGLKEMSRVLKPEGRLAVLEISVPKAFPVKQLFYTYFRYILPTIGRLFSKDTRAYTYLPESVKVFPEGEKFTSILNNTGYSEAKCKKLTFGICSLYTAKK